MLEVMNQDYVRTARAKGLTERTVIVRHAFRNALIPLATIIAFDFGGVIGGAVITETVFGWSGMGKLFIDGPENVDPNPVMAFFLVTGTAIVLFNMIADIVYASSTRGSGWHENGQRPLDERIEQCRHGSPGDDSMAPASTRLAEGTGRLGRPCTPGPRSVRRRFFRHRAAMVGLIVLAFIILLAFTSIGFGPDPRLVELGLHRHRTALINQAAHRP